MTISEVRDNIRGELARLRDGIRARRKLFEEHDQEASIAILELEKSAFDVYKFLKFMVDQLHSMAESEEAATSEAIASHYEEQAERLEPEISEVDTLIRDWEAMIDQYGEEASSTLHGLLLTDLAYKEQLEGRKRRLEALAANPPSADWESLKALQLLSERLRTALDSFPASPPGTGVHTSSAKFWLSFAESGWPKIQLAAGYGGPAVIAVNPPLGAAIIGFAGLMGFLEAFKEEITFAPSNLFKKRYKGEISKQYEVLVTSLEEAMAHLETSW